MEEIKFFDIDITEFNELIDNKKIELINKNTEYKKLQEQYYFMMKKYPKLQLIFEENEELILNKTECKMLQKLMQIGLEIDEIEKYFIFFLGGNQAYFYFKKLRILKE